jgi:hypothetical protein
VEVDDLVLRSSALVLILLAVAGLLTFVTLRMDWDLPSASLGSSGARGGPPDEFIRRAGYHGGRLWTVSYGGELWSLAENEATPRRELAAFRVVDLCDEGSQLEALVVEGAGWRLETLQGGVWTPGVPIAAKEDFALSLICDGQTRLLTDRRVIDARTGERIALLQKRLPTFPDNRATAIGREIYFSTGSGEVGTAFYRIDPETGVTDTVRDNGADPDCGTLINACLEVTAVVPAPWDRQCILLSQRASHAGSHGRVTELCRGGAARIVHKGPCFFQPSTDRGCSEEFDGLVVRGGAVLAAGSNGLVELGHAGAGAQVALPAFESRWPLHVGFAQDFVVISLEGLPRRHGPHRIMLVHKTPDIGRTAVTDRRG